MNPRQDIVKITMYSTSWCGDCVRAKSFFNDYKIDYSEIDIEHDTDAADVVTGINGGNRTVPTILVDFADGSRDVLVEPSYDELAKTLLA